MAEPKKTPQGTWRVQIYVSGVREGGTFPTKREALEWASRRKLELKTPKKVRDSGITLEKAVQRYKLEISPGKKGEAKEVIRLDAFLKQPKFPGSVRVTDLTVQHLADWRDERLKVNARGSVLRDMTLLSSVLEACRRDWQLIAENPMRDVRKPAEPDHREIIIKPWQIRAMLKALGWIPRGQARTVGHAVAGAFLVALQTGARAGELCNVRWNEVFDAHFLVDGKTGKREVPMTPTTRRVIERMRGFDADKVFGLTPQTLDAMFRKYRKQAGLEGFTFHDSRHTAATRLAQYLHVLDLCKMFGWTSTTRALVYYNPTGADIAKRISGQAPRPQHHSRGISHPSQGAGN